MSGTARNLLRLGALLLTGADLNAPAAPPTLSAISPAAIAPGKPTRLKLTGDNLAGAVDLWTSFPGEVDPGHSPDSVEFNVTIPVESPTGIGAVQLTTTNGLSAFQLVLIDPFPSRASNGKNHSETTAQTIAVGEAIDGTCDELRSDYFRFHAKKGDPLHIEVVAQRIGSSLDPLLRLLDANGREIGFNDDTPGLGADARLAATCPRTGDYLVELRDSRYGGGPRHRYRLRFGDFLPSPLPFLATPELSRMTAPVESFPAVLEHEPNDDTNCAQSFSIPAELRGDFKRNGDRDIYEFEAAEGQRIVFTGRTRSLGSPCDLFLQLQSTNGTKIAASNATGEDEGALTNRFTAGGRYQLVVEELNRSGGPTLAYRVVARELKPGFQLSTEMDHLSGPAGEAFEIEVKADRRDYDGPIELIPQGLPPEFTIENNLIAAKTNSTRMKISAPANLPLGETVHLGILGQATIADTTWSDRVSTRPALGAAFPTLRHPPSELDGLVTLSISRSKSANPPPARKKKKK